MGQRITIVLDDELLVKLRNLQAKKLRNSQESVSFSRILNEVLETGLKKK